MSGTDRLTGLVGYSGMKVPVIAATTAAITLSGEQTIDGIACVTDDRVLVKDQASAVNNGIYVVDTGDWSRAPDADGPFDFVFGTLVPVASGTVNGGAVFRLTTTGTITPGTSSLSFSTMGLLSTPVPIASGGTNAITVAAAQANLLIGTQSTVASSTTPDIWTGTGTQIDFTGSTGPVTGFAAAPRAGIWRTLVCASTPQFTHSASLALPGSANYTATAGDIIAVYALTTTTFRLTILKSDGTAVVNTVASTPLPQGYGYGMTLSNGTDAINDIDIAVGAARDATNGYNITLAAALTKRLDANWAAGTNQGGRYSGAAIADTTYGVWGCTTAAGTADVYFYPNSGGPSAATVLTALQAESGGSSYVGVRRIGLIVRSAGNILAFSQLGDEFLLSIAVLDIDVTNPGTSAVTRTLATCPIGTKVQAILNVRCYNGTSNGFTNYISSLDQSDQAASGTAAPLGSNMGGIREGVATGGEIPAGWMRVRTNTSAQVRSRANVSGASDTLKIATLGWVDNRWGSV